jgi:hypothetical protein
LAAGAIGTIVGAWRLRKTGARHDRVEVIEVDYVVHDDPRGRRDPSPWAKDRHGRDASGSGS